MRFGVGLGLGLEWVVGGCVGVRRVLRGWEVGWFRNIEFVNLWQM